MKRILLVMALMAFALGLTAQDVGHNETVINDVTPPPSSLPPAIK